MFFLVRSFWPFIPSSSSCCSHWVCCSFVQIVRQDRTMEEIVFPVPNICEFLTSESKVRVYYTTERDEQGSKINDFFLRAEDLFNEMNWQKKLRGELRMKDTWETVAGGFISVCLIVLFIFSLSVSSEFSAVWLWTVYCESTVWILLQVLMPNRNILTLVFVDQLKFNGFPKYG